jgi:outer membrane protein
VKKIAKFLIVSLGLTSTATYAEDLLQVFEQSLKSDPQLLAERASVNAVVELGDQAIARFLPQLGVSANTGQVRRDSSAQIFGGSQEYNSHGYSLNLTQPVYRRQNFVQSEQADIALESAQAGYQEAEQSLIVRVAERYFDLLAKQDDLGFAQAETEANAKQLEQVKLQT